MAEYIHVYICVYMCIYIYIYVYMLCVYIYTYTYMFISLFIHVCKILEIWSFMDLMPMAMFLGTSSPRQMSRSIRHACNRLKERLLCEYAKFCLKGKQRFKKTVGLFHKALLDFCCLKKES